MLLHPFISATHLEEISKIIGDTTTGLTGGEISKLLNDNRITDADPTGTKWKRLYNAFGNCQNTERKSEKIFNFLTQALNPARYLGKRELYDHRLNNINRQLSFIGLEIMRDGNIRNVIAATTLSDAEMRASTFKSKLEARNVHSEIYRYCSPELLNENYFHSVFEAIKSIAERVRFMSNVHADGNPLIDTAFSTSAPLIRINLLNDDTHRSEHIGLSNLIKGLLGLIRNPTAHKPKITFIIEEEEALEIMTIISYVHRRLDKAL